jgi:hypothetical protein
MTAARSARWSAIAAGVTSGTGECRRLWPPVSWPSPLRIRTSTATPPTSAQHRTRRPNDADQLGETRTYRHFLARGTIGCLLGIGVGRDRPNRLARHVSGFVLACTHTRRRDTGCCSQIRRISMHGHRYLGISVEASTQGVTAIRAEVDALRASSGDDDEVTLTTGLSYRPGHPVSIRVRRRGSRYDITDAASAVNLAGRPDGWLATAFELTWQGVALSSVSRLEERQVDKA